MMDNSYYNRIETRVEEKGNMTKRLYRLQSSKMIGGVCAGIARYFDLDVSLIRLLFVGIALITALFPMFLFYIIAWIIIPTEEEVVKNKKENKSSE
jgi:phage shock protein C